MNFAQQQRDPRRHLFGITTVILLHAVVIYALTNGLGRKVVEVLKKPLEVSIIEEVQTPPPPPKVVVQPKVIPPPPAFVPPPEVQVQAPPPVIAATAPVPAPPAPPAPQVVSVGVVCPGYQSSLARGLVPAQTQGLSGRVNVEFTISAGGAVGGVRILKSTNPALNAIASNAVAQLRCEGQGQSVRAYVPIVVELER